MANLEGMKIKFTVMKNSELHKLHHDHQFNVAAAESLIGLNRLNAGKESYPTYLVINTDEPYADEVIEILKRHGHWGEGNV